MLLADYYIYNGLMGGHFDLVDELLDHGARIEDIQRRIIWAKENGYDLMCEKLLKYERNGFGASESYN